MAQSLISKLDFLNRKMWRAYRVFRVHIECFAPRPPSQRFKILEERKRNPVQKKKIEKIK